MPFKTDDRVVWVNNGEEIPAIVKGYGTSQNGDFIYVLEVGGEVKNVTESEVLAVKKPGFEIRDLAFVIDENKQAVQGEIVEIGIGSNRRRFYQLWFEDTDGPTNWYSEDEVFIMSELPSNDDFEVTF